VKRIPAYTATAGVIDGAFSVMTVEQAKTRAHSHIDAMIDGTAITSDESTLAMIHDLVLAIRQAVKTLEGETE